MNPSVVPRARAARERAEVVRHKAVEAIESARAVNECALDTQLLVWQGRLNERIYTSRDATLERSLDAALSVASADFANIQRINPDGHGLALIAQRGFTPSLLDYFEFVDDGTAAWGVALRDHRPVVVRDVLGSRIFRGTPGLDVLLAAGVRSVTSMPLVDRHGRLVGVLSVHYRKPHLCVDSELRRLKALACTIADIIEP